MRIKTRKEQERIINEGNILVLVSGNIASGKTTLSKKLSKDLKFPFIEVNNQYNPNSKNIILESTGLGYRTRDIKNLYKKVFIVKCWVTEDQAIKNINNRKKIFKSHEIRLGMSQIDFYYHCLKDVDRLKADICYNYNTDNYKMMLKTLSTWIYEGGGAG